MPTIFAQLFCLLAGVYLLGIPPLIRAQQSDTRGIPSNMGTGVTETVQDIMNRGNPAENRQPGQTLRIVPIGRADRQNLNQDPNAPDVPRWPYSGGAGSMGRQPASDVVSPGEGPLAPQTVGVSVVAATSADSPFIPPDSMGAVGPTQALAIENGIIRTFNKSGAPDGAIDTSTDNFFDSVRNAAGTSDPQVTFDRISNRWFIEMITVTPPNRIMIAMSSGPAIASASSFTLFQFQQDLVGTTPNSDTGGLADQGRLGVDKNALYIAANIFNAAGTSFIGSTGFVVRKSDLILNNTLTVTAFRQLGTGSASGPFAPQGVDNDDPNATEGYFIGVDTLLFGRLQIRRITDPGGSPSISANLSLTVPATASPIRVPAQGSIRPLDGGDDRLIMAQIKKGSLWAAHQIQVNSSGNASNSGGRDGVRWYQITNLTGTPTLNQSGTLFDSSATNPVYYFYGSPAASGQGHMALASSYAANMPFAGGTIQGYPGVAYTGRLATDAPGTLNTSINRTLGVGAYNVQSTNPQRWGDYSKTTVDPNDDMTMWTFQERSNSSTGNGSWGVIMTQLKAPPPATPSSASPSFAGAGAKLNVAITGTPNSGSGFFDPGSGFPNHISAAVNGGGVTINGITFNTPANITLNVTVDSGATPGNRTVTVTNPDGQQATSASGIFTINAASITLSPATLPYGVVGASYNQTITASGGTSPYTFGILAGALPHGLTLSSGGMISGTLTTSGTADFTVGVQDSLFATGNRAYTFKVADVISSNVSLSVTSTRFDPTPSPGFEGKYTFNTTLTNNGRALGSPVFFKITDLRKVGTDLNPAQPDKLLSADNGAGLVGDIETVGMASLGTGASTPVTFLIGIGSRQAFRFGIDLYGVVPGTAITSLDNVTLKTAVVVTPAAAILLGRFQFEISEGKLAVLATRHSIFSAPDTNANVAVITGPGPQSRPVVAVDPILASRMAVASNDYAAGTVQVKSSLDGGKTWHAAEMSRTLGEQSFFAAHNPGLAFDSRGNLSVVYTLSNLNDAANAIVISESEDGIHFSPPAAISFHPASDRIIDSRPVIAIRHGTGRYVAWDSLSTQTGRYDVKVVQSVDSGPFGPAVNVVSNSLVSSAALAVSRNKLYVGWDEWGFNSSFPYTTGGRLMMSSARLGRELLFSELQELARTGIGFSRKIAPMPERGASPDLRLAVDPKKNNVVYAVFADQGNGIDVLYTVSNNGGRTWQPPVVVNDDTSFADQFDPAIGLDSRGTLNIAFYDTRLSSTSTAADVFMASSSSGNRFAANKRITTIGSDDSTANPSRDYIANLGDRIGVAAVTDNAIVVWTDTRLGSEDIFLSIVGNQ